MKWFLITCYLACILRARCQGEFLGSEERIVNENDSVSRIDERIRSLSWTNYETKHHREERDLVEQSGQLEEEERELECNRYCVETRSDGTRKGYNNESVQRINLLWSTRKEESGDYLNGYFRKIDLPKDLANGEYSSTANKKCQMYLELGCYTAETGSHLTNWGKNAYGAMESDEENRNLIDRNELTGYTVAKFHVNDYIRKIRIDIWGNLSHAILEIPMSETTKAVRPIVSLTHKGISQGVEVEARNAPPGAWCLKLFGVENSNYGFTVVARTQKTINAPVLTDDRSFKKHVSRETIPEKYSDPRTYVTHDGVDNRKQAQQDDGVFIRTNLEAITDAKEVRNKALLPDTPYNKKSIIERSLDDSIPRSSDLVVFPTSSINNDTEKRNDFQKRKTNVPRVAANESELYGTIEDGPMRANLSMRMVETAEDREISDAEVFANLNTDEITKKRKIVVELNLNSDLIVTPNTIHRTVFDVTNNQPEAARCVFKVKSTHFRIYNLYPLYSWIFTGQTANVIVDIVIPREIAQDTVNTITLFVESNEVAEKSIYLYPQNWIDKITDDVRPTIAYSFNNNCAGRLDREKCAKSRWSADITIHDPDSGLKRVTASPNDLVPRTDFISGTRNSITFYYTSTCCSTTARITATDLLNNQHTRTIDVTAWDNLSQGEIAAIVVGALLILLLVILIVLIIIYCVRKKKSEDLPYTQRYGSRAPGRAERTSF